MMAWKQLRHVGTQLVKANVINWLEKYSNYIGYLNLLTHVPIANLYPPPETKLQPEKGVLKV